MLPAFRSVTPALVHPRAWLALIITAFVGLSVAYNFTLPIFEGFDETAHYRVVDYYTRHLDLPNLDRAPSHEAHQPPLYYALGALLIAPLDRADFDTTFQVNQNATVNVRQNIAPTDYSVFPTGTTLAVRVLRLYSTLLGALTILVTYCLASELRLDTATSLLAAGLLALNPKFIALSSSISNDIAAILLATVCLLLCARVVSRPSSRIVAFALGGSVGLGILSKYSGLAVGIPAALALFGAVTSHARGSVAIRQLVIIGAVFLAGVALVCGWLFAIQWQRYGSPLAWEQVNALNVFAQREAPLTLTQLAANIPPILPTLWRLNADASAQSIGDVISVLLLGAAVLGWIISARRRTLAPALWLLPLAIVASLVALLPWMRTHGGSEDSRLLSSIFSSMAVLTAAGLAALIRSRWMLPIVIGLSVIWAAVAPALLITPRYPPLAPLTRSDYVMQLAPSEIGTLPAQPVARFDNGIELASANLLSDRLSSGEPARVELVWRVTRAVIRPYKLIIEALDPAGNSVGRLGAEPLDGRKSTRLWSVGDVYRDTYVLTIPASDKPVIAALYVGWHDSEPPYKLALVADSGAHSANIGRVKVRPATALTATPRFSSDAVFGTAITLLGYDHTDDQLTLYWRANTHMQVDYQVFVHLLDASGNIITQADAPMPYPTSLWDAQEMVLDQRTINGLANADTVLVGVYDLSSGVRLTALRADGSAWADNSVPLQLQ